MSFNEKLVHIIVQATGLTHEARVKVILNEEYYFNKEFLHKWEAFTQAIEMGKMFHKLGYDGVIHNDAHDVVRDAFDDILKFSEFERDLRLLTRISDVFLNFKTSETFPDLEREEEVRFNRNLINDLIAWY